MDQFIVGSALFIAIGMVISGLEDILARRELALVQARPVSRFRVQVLVSGGLIGLGIALAASSVAGSIVVSAALEVALLATLFMRSKLFGGNDGADRMYLVLLVLLISTQAAVESGVPALTLGARWIIVLMIGLVYLESGLAKLRVASWRSGRSLGLILNVPETGEQHAARLLLNHPGIGRVLSWGTIAVESTAIAAFLIGGPVAAASVVLLLTLHIGIAVLMGLGRFLWCFSSALLLILWANGPGAPYPILPSFSGL